MRCTEDPENRYDYMLMFVFVFFTNFFLLAFGSVVLLNNTLDLVMN